MVKSASRPAAFLMTRNVVSKPPISAELKSSNEVRSSTLHTAHLSCWWQLRARPLVSLENLQSMFAHGLEPVILSCNLKLKIYCGAQCEDSVIKNCVRRLKLMLLKSMKAIRCDSSPKPYMLYASQDSTTPYATCHNCYETVSHMFPATNLLSDYGSHPFSF